MKKAKTQYIFQEILYDYNMFYMKYITNITHYVHELQRSAEPSHRIFIPPSDLF